MFDGFETKTVAGDRADVHLRVGGDGPPLLLLHGYPETHLMWHAVAPALAESFTVVAADLRGYGGSGKPAPAPDHSTYSKRAMAADAVAAMGALGFERFAVAGHDRGGRVAYRMALDHPERVTRLAVLDMVPTVDMLERVDHETAGAFWHWFFLSRPPGLPERVLARAWEQILLEPFGSVLDGPALADYRRALADPLVQRAICEDYRAQMTVDLAHDRADRGRRTIDCPVLALWGAEGLLPGRVDVLATWRRWARDVDGAELACGHFLPEERSAETAAALHAFFS